VNSLAITLLLVNAALILSLPRRYAPLPLLAGACLMTVGLEIDIGVFHFTAIRILIAAGIVRIILRGERLAGEINGLDWLMVAWSAWGLASSYFHKDPSAALVFRLGLVYTNFGIYFLFRVFCESLDDVERLCRITAIVLLIVAIEMLFESMTDYNLFSLLGGISETPTIREGRIRAQGPFDHSILAGTVGAVCLPLFVGIWKQDLKMTVVGVAACITMIITSASAGPIMSAVAGIAALVMWNYRENMRLVRWVVPLGYIGLDMIMKDPAYYIISRIGLVSGSGGYHRAALIESAIQHLDEWWLAGTDYTRHWMPTGVSWSPDHTDITNYYLHMGVVGGLPWMLLFMAILAKGFSFVGVKIDQASDLPDKSRFMLWALGSALFAHAVTAISVSYFDQSSLFIYLNLAAIGSVWSSETS